MRFMVRLRPGRAREPAAHDSFRTSEMTRILDVSYERRERSVAAWLCGEVLIDCGPASSAERLVEQLDGRTPRALLLTHVHLDHAGAAGSLVERWPQLPVYVHPKGAPHLADPA